MLGKRNARHKTVRSVQAGSHESWYEFAAGQRVMTVDGYAGKVTAVQDGPFAGNEAYDVLLDNGMGGGLYTSGQLKPLNERTSDLHTAADDYPELGSILSERPDIAPNQVLGSRTAVHVWDQISGHTQTPDLTHSTCSICGVGQVGNGKGGLHDMELSPGAGAHDHVCESCAQSSMPDLHAGAPNMDRMRQYKPLEHGLAPSLNAYHEYDHDVCPTCQGEKSSPEGHFAPWEDDRCPTCHGTGAQPQMDRHSEPEHYMPQASVQAGRACPNCGSTHTNDTPDRIGGEHRQCMSCGGVYKHSPQALDDRFQHFMPTRDAPDFAHEMMKSVNSLQSTAKKRLFPCAYCQANQMGTGSYGQHCAQCPNETPHDLEAHGHTEEQHSQQQLLADIAEHLENCPVVPHQVNNDYMSGMHSFAVTQEERDAYQRVLDDSKNHAHFGPAQSEWERGSGSGGEWNRGEFNIKYYPRHEGPQEACPTCGKTTQHDETSADHILARSALDADFRFHVTSSWADVRNKAKGLRQSGRVRILAASDGYIAGEVLGENHVYSTVLQRMPGKLAVAAWECGCKWAAYAWGRSEPYRRFEGRMCSHALALRFEAQSRGMFGREIYEDPQRPGWQYAHDPVVVRYDRDKKTDDARRAYPPANMKRVFTSALEDAEDSTVIGVMLTGVTQPTAEIMLMAANINKEAFWPLLLPLLEGGGEAAGAAAAGTGLAEGAAGLAEGAGAAGEAGGGIGSKIKDFITDKGGPQSGGGSGQPQQAPQSAPQRILPANGDYSAPTRFSALTNPTEPALPMTTGDDGDSGMGQEDGDMNGPGNQSLTPESEDDSRTAALADGIDLSWIMKGSSAGSGDIAAAASEYLNKTALKDFTPGEQMALIEEGKGIRAGNLDRLQIADTHYATLADDDDESWLA